jgi:hypothetical protein
MRTGRRPQGVFARLARAVSANGVFGGRRGIREVGAQARGCRKGSWYWMERTRCRSTWNEVLRLRLASIKRPTAGAGHRIRTVSPPRAGSGSRCRNTRPRSGAVNANGGRCRQGATGGALARFSDRARNKRASRARKGPVGGVWFSARRRHGSRQQRNSFTWRCSDLGVSAGTWSGHSL